MEFKKIYIKYNFNTLSAFSRFLGIPLRTCQNWYYGLRECPDYLLKLIDFYCNVTLMR